MVVCSCARNAAQIRCQSGVGRSQRATERKADSERHGEGAPDVPRRRLQLLGNIAGVALSLGTGVGGK